MIISMMQGQNYVKRNSNSRDKGTVKLLPRVFMVWEEKPSVEIVREFFNLLTWWIIASAGNKIFESLHSGMGGMWMFGEYSLSMVKELEKDLLNIVGLMDGSVIIRPFADLSGIVQGGFRNLELA